ncbi:MAG: hypothetical protein SGJ02_02555 [bacterium]|mgnify:CR=1 FL=1|nr:hypothetical protein [bacterium]
MKFSDDIEYLKRIIRNPFKTLEEVDEIASRLDDSCDADEFYSTVTNLIDLCEEAVSNFGCISSQIQEIQRKWGFASVRRLPVKTITDWDKWQRGLQDKLPRKENYNQDLKTLLNTWKGDNWGFFVEQQLFFETWHLEGKMWTKEDIDSPYLPSVITRPKDPRTQDEKNLDQQMLRVTNIEHSKVEYDAVRKKDHLNPSLAKEVAEFKLRETSTRINQAKTQAEDLARESVKQGKPSRITYYFYEQPSDKKVEKILEIYKTASEKHSGARVEVKFLFAEDGDRK